MRYGYIFNIIDLEDGDSQALIEIEKVKEARKRIKEASRQAKYKRLMFCKRKDAEEKGICQSCEEKKEYLRFVLDYELLICYDCFYHDMQQAGEFYSYHGRRAEDMDGFLYEDEWEDLWEEENGYPGYACLEEESERKRHVDDGLDEYDMFETLNKQLDVIDEEYKDLINKPSDEFLKMI